MNTTLQHTPLPSPLVLYPPSSDRFVPDEIITIPQKPSAPPHTPKPNQPTFSVVMGNPLSPSSMSRGNKLTLIDHLNVCNSTSNAQFLASISALSASYKPNPNLKPKRPRHSLKNHNSGLIGRCFISDVLVKEMQQSNFSEQLFFLNSQNSLILLTKKNEVLMKVEFKTEWPLCHALNPTTANANQLDIVVGMSNGDLVLIDLVSQKYERFNKHGNITHTPITAVSWLPNSMQLVMAAHVDGTVVIYDMHGEDGEVSNYEKDSNLSLLASEQKQLVKAVYKISKKQITQILFISTFQAVLSSKTDYLILFNLNVETITTLLPTYFGGVYCMAVSPDNRYLAAAGEDDMVNVFDLANELKLAARFQGHKAYIKSISFDYFQDFSEGMYRLASVAEDRQLIIWDFEPQTLTAPKLPPNAEDSKELLWAAQNHLLEGTNTAVVGRVPQFAAKTVAPTARVYVKHEKFGDSQLTDVKFTSGGLVVATANGYLWKWRREHPHEFDSERS